MKYSLDIHKSRGIIGQKSHAFLYAPIAGGFGLPVGNSERRETKLTVDTTAHTSGLTTPEDTSISHGGARADGYFMAMVLTTFRQATSALTYWRGRHSGTLSA